MAVLAVLTVLVWSYAFVYAFASRGDDPAANEPGPLAATPSSAAGDGTASTGDDGGGFDVVVVGDAWTDPRWQPAGSFLSVAAERLGWQARVIEDGGGTGYLSRGPAESGRFVERLRQQPVDPDVDLVVLQGGSADGPILSANPTIPLAAAVRRALEAAQEQHAGAEVLVLAPVTTPGPGADVTIDRTLGRVARSAGAEYLSPLRRGWLTEGDGSLDVATGLPGPLGRARLADRFTAAVEDLALTR